MKKSNYNRSGFTLAESMMAMVILAIAASGVLLPFSNAASVHIEGSRQTLAAKLAADLLEEISASNYIEIINDWDGSTESEGDVTKAFSSDVYSGEVYRYFSRQAECQPVTIGSGRDTTILGIWVSVTVSFDGREMVTLKTLVSQ